MDGLTTETGGVPVTGIAYFELPGFAQKLFRCTRRAAALRPAACAANWEKAQELRNGAGGTAEVCRACPVGAAHAGKAVSYRNPLFGIDLCPRCRRGGMRVVGNRLCISCYNREREVRIGRNRKGTVPHKLELRPCKIGVILDAGTAAERRVIFESAAARDERELEIVVLRVTAGHVQFFEVSGAPVKASKWRPEPLLASALFAGVGEGRGVRPRSSLRMEPRRQTTRQLSGP